MDFLPVWVVTCCVYYEFVQGSFTHNTPHLFSYSPHTLSSFWLFTTWRSFIPFYYCFLFTPIYFLHSPPNLSGFLLYWFRLFPPPPSVVLTARCLCVFFFFREWLTFLLIPYVAPLGKCISPIHDLYPFFPTYPFPLSPPLHFIAPPFMTVTIFFLSSCHGKLCIPPLCSR